MSIWFRQFDVEELGKFQHDTMGEHLGIEVTDIGADYLEARMPVDGRTMQPDRILHGGASVALAETLGSVGGSMGWETRSSRSSNWVRESIFRPCAVSRSA